MTPRRRSLIRRALPAALALAVVLPASASAQQARTYVDRANGSDANDCLYETPCLSFQRAHDVTVPDGEINVKAPGNYSSLTITKPITIDGNGNVATITPFGMGVTVNLTGGNGGKVVLRDIRINAAATLGAGGIDILRGANVITDNVRIYGGSLAGIRVLNSQDPSSRLTFDDSKIQGSSGQGIVFEPTGNRVARATIRNSTIDDNRGAAIHLKPAGGAIVRATVRNAHIDNNKNGIIAESAGGVGTATANVFSSAITDSGLESGGAGIGIYSSGPNSVVRISRNEIQHNNRGLHWVNGGQILSAGDNDVVGNSVNGTRSGVFGRT